MYINQICVIHIIHTYTQTDMYIIDTYTDTYIQTHIHMHVYTQIETYKYSMIKKNASNCLHTHKSIPLQVELKNSSAHKIHLYLLYV